MSFTCQQLHVSVTEIYQLHADKIANCFSFLCQGGTVFLLVTFLTLTIDGRLTASINQTSEKHGTLFISLINKEIITLLTNEEV